MNVTLNYKPHDKQLEVHSDNHRFKIICAGRRFGKALDVNTLVPVPTTEMYKKMGDLVIGDKVFDENGEVCNVVQATEYQLDRDCYEVELSDGAKIIADANHNWIVTSYEYYKAEGRAKDKSNISIPKYEQKTTEELKSTIYYDKRGGHRWSIEPNKPIEFSKKELSINPYILGVWLGDGCSYYNEISCHEDDYQHYHDEFIERGVNVGEYKIASKSKKSGKFRFGLINYSEDYKIVTRCYNGIIRTYKSISKRRKGKAKADGVVTKEGYKQKLRDLDLLQNKHIPLIYMQSSIKQRIELIRGLMDTDGYISKKGDCYFYNTNEQIINSFTYILSTLGVIYSKLIKKTYKKDCFVIKFASFDFCPFLLKRKSDRYFGRIKRRKNTRLIKSITKVDSRPVKCIQVDSVNNMYLCGESFIPTHNSLLSVVEIIRYCLKNPVKNTPNIGYIAPTYQICERGIEAFQKIDPLNKLHKKKGKSPVVIDLITGHRVFFLSADHPDSMRGQGFVFAVLDEADFIADSTFRDVIRPTLSDNIAPAVFISTPKRKHSYFHKLFLTGLNEHEYIQSFHFKSADNPYMPLQEVENAKKELPADTFRQEYEAEWIESGGEVFTNLDGCKVNSYCNCTSCSTLLGIDLGRHKDFTVFTALCPYCMHIKEIYRINKMDWNIQEEILLSKWNDYSSLGNCITILDANSIGDVIMDNLRAKGMEIVAFKFSNSSKVKLINDLRAKISTNEIKINMNLENAEQLIKELEGYEQQMTKTGLITYNNGLSIGFDDCVISLALCVHGLNNFINPTTNVDIYIDEEEYNIWNDDSQIWH